MNIQKILQRSWQIVWQYRALWILGMILALTAANTIYFGNRQDIQDQPQNLKIKFTDTFTINLPGDGLTIDLTVPEGERVIFSDGTTERDLRFLTDLTNEIRLSDIMAIGIEILILLVLISLISTIARYVAETAVIRMVSETEETGKLLTLRQGFSMGWSVRAVRLFLIDLLVGLVIGGIVAFVLSLSIGPIILVESLGFFPILLTAFGVLGLLIFTGLLLAVISALLSLIMQTVRRACVIDNMGVFASIGTGITMLRHHLKDVGIAWLIWIGIRILWAPVSLMVALILLPVLLVFLLAGVVVGVVPAALAAGIASPFVNGVTPWIIGVIAGLPIFILVMILPLLFVGGWVEIYKSNLWTLTYRELIVMEHTVQATQPKQPLTPAHGVTR
jgi:hypothetical protein